MQKITIYTTTTCPYCVRAKALLDRKGATYQEVNAEDPSIREEMIQKAGGRKTVPQIFIGDFHVGGCNDLYELELATLAGHTKPQTFWGFLLLGIEHILTGFDHLAFLLALLLAGSRLREALKIITSFTIAHSITLALATLNWVNLPANIVEPLIAVSIIYVGIENLFRREIKGRWLLTFAFGLIHGFGFAGVLRELGIGADGNVVMPLLTFNLGVELGQIGIAALVLPLIWKLRQQPAFVPRYVPACSLLVALAGGYWLVQRTLF